MLYHLNNIIKLDTLALSEEAKAFAEATFMKKKMYYNMKVKTIQRCFSSVIRLLKKAKKVKSDLTYKDIALAHKRFLQLQNPDDVILIFDNTC